MWNDDEDCAEYKEAVARGEAWYGPFHWASWDDGTDTEAPSSQPDDSQMSQSSVEVPVAVPVPTNVIVPTNEEIMAEIRETIAVLDEEISQQREADEVHAVRRQAMVETVALPAHWRRVRLEVVPLDDESGIIFVDHSSEEEN